MKQLAFPLDLTFRVSTVANDFRVIDANGQEVAYVRQKIWKLKSEVEVFTDKHKSTLLYTMRADKVIGMNYTFTITDPEGRELGSVTRKGMASIFRAYYEIKKAGELKYLIREKNPWAKVWDALLSELPLLGILSAYVFHPAYVVRDPVSNEELALLKKRPSFFGRKFKLDKLKQELTGEEEALVLMSSMRVLLLERRRG